MSYFRLHQLCQDQKSKLGHLNMGIQTVMANAVDVHQTNMYTQGMNICVVHTGCKESQFYSLPFGQAVASMY